MGSLVISTKILDKYFGYLKNFDDKAKKILITKLTKSLQVKPKRNPNLKSMYGAWKDDRDSDVIIEEIQSSRVEKHPTGNWK